MITTTTIQHRYCVDAAVAEAERRGLLRVLERHPAGDANGFLLARYAWDTAPAPAPAPAPATAPAGAADV